VQSPAGICYDRYGASIGLTEAFLGHVAAERLTIILRSSGTGNRPGTSFSPANGVECVRGTGPCRIKRRPSAALTAALYAPTARPIGQTAEMRAIMYGEWDWQRTRYNNGTEARPRESKHYVLRFEPDGHLEARVDCNSAGGNYRFENNRISLELANSTLMSCEPGSFEEVFKQNLVDVGSYFMNGGRLFLDLRKGAATMEFDRTALHATPEP
jgi:heat shock protein HslJ